jgi:hypothetical protein
MEAMVKIKEALGQRERVPIEFASKPPLKEVNTS